MPEWRQEPTIRRTLNKSGREDHGLWLTRIESSIKGKRVLAIIDPAVEKAFSVTVQIQRLQKAAQFVSFTEFTPNPTWESLLDILQLTYNSKPETLIAIGGGTAIDLAKLTAIAIELGGAEELWQASQTQPSLLEERSSVRLVTIPTTAGTGAEATRFAVLYRDNIKYSIAGDGLKPDQAILDSSLLKTLPTGVIADAGLDAVCQAMESLWSVRSTPESEKEAWQALRLANKHLRPAVTTRGSEHLEAMLQAAHLAGRAINITTTTAPHALSYGLTTEFGIPHGRAVALLFGPIFGQMLACDESHCHHPKGPSFLTDRLIEIARAWGQEAERFPRWWQAYLKEALAIANIEVSVSSSQLETLVQGVNSKRLANNPVPFSPVQIKEIYQSVLGNILD